MNLLKTLAAISSMTMLSRVTGLLRESLMARRNDDEEKEKNQANECHAEPQISAPKVCMCPLMIFDAVA